MQKTNGKATQPKCQQRRPRSARYTRQRSVETQTEARSSCLWRTLSRTLGGRAGRKQSRSAANTAGTSVNTAGIKRPGPGPPRLLLMLNRWDLFWSHPCQASGGECNPSAPRCPSDSCLSVARSPTSKQTQSWGNRGALPRVYLPVCRPVTRRQMVMKRPANAARLTVPAAWKPSTSPWLA